MIRWAAFAFGLLSWDCRRLTAEPAKAEAIPQSFIIAESVYDGGLKAGWQDWGWGKHDLSAGSAKIDLSQYGGWMLHHDSFTARFGALAFRMRAAGVSGEFLQARLANGNDDVSFPAVDITPERTRALADGWVQVYVSWKDLNPNGQPFDRVTLHAKTQVSNAFILFDKVGLTQFDAKLAGQPNGPGGAERRVKLSASCTAPSHPINPDIYGVAGDGLEIGATTRRWGGNTTTRYNWSLGATNVGKDWYFENGKADHRKFFEDNKTQHTTGALTVPMIGWIAKDTSSFGFPLSVYGPQRAHDPYKPDAGDGARADGSSIKPNAPTQTSVPASPELVQRWVASIVQNDQKTQTRSVHEYILDNEPNLWSSNHRDVHPDPVTYDELLDRTVRYGTAIRNADPQAVIAGPAEWGWTGYLYSARDLESGVFLRPDRRAHGDVPLVPWYLKKVHEHDVATGIRVLDVLDLHFYPQGQGVWSPNSDPATAALRLRSTRALWDPKYKDESWINDTVRLIPRMKEWVAQNYPGLRISLGEWNFGAEQHISGGLAVAEVLGRFGTEGLDSAYYWASPPKNSPAFWAFRAFRNFDGKGGQFLGRSMAAQMDGEVSLFASRDESGKHLVLIALNLSPTSAAKASIGLAGCAPIASRRRFTYQEHSTTLEDQGDKSGGPFEETLPPYSVNVFDVLLK